MGRRPAVTLKEKSKKKVRESFNGDGVKGVPANLSLNVVAAWVEPRVSKKRFKHIKGVANVGRKLANAALIDPYPVELACLLHDACKEMKKEELVEAARAFGHHLTPEQAENGHLLHGPVAAHLVRKELHITNPDILAGIAQHTMGAIEMCTISKMTYLADKLEPSRPDEMTYPIWRAMGVIPEEDQFEEDDELLLEGEELDLDRGISTAMNLIIANLIRKDKHVQTGAVVIRNHYLKLVKQRVQ